MTFSRTEITNIRIDMLKEMNDFIRKNIKDEQDVLLWNCFCIPENPTNRDFIENSMDDEFNDCCEFFQGIIERAGVLVK